MSVIVIKYIKEVCNKYKKSKYMYVIYEDVRADMSMFKMYGSQLQLLFRKLGID
jgi:hypothetical protein